MANEVTETSREQVFLTCRKKTPLDRYISEKTNDEKSRGWFFILEISLIVLTSLALVSTLTIHGLIVKVLWSLPLWKWELMLLGIISLRHIIKMILTIFTSLATKIFRSKRRVVYFLHGIQSDVEFCITVSIIFGALYVLLSEKATTEPTMVVITASKASSICTLLSVISLIKSGVVMYLSTWFHMMAYQDWIEETIFNWYVVESFLGVSYQKNRHLWNSKKTSAWSMKKKIINKKVGLCKTIKDEFDAQSTASKIVETIAKPGSIFINLADVSRFLPRDDAIKFMTFFQISNEIQPHQISIPLLQEWMVHVLREEKSLFLSLKTMEVTKNKANEVIKFITWIILITLFFTLIGIVRPKIFTIFSTSFAFTSFVFGAALKTIFDSMVFVFIEHPFDVGDRCEIEEKQMVVEDIHVLHTVFVGLDKTRYDYANDNLRTKKIVNFDRGCKYTKWELKKEKKEEAKEKNEEAKEKND